MTTPPLIKLTKNGVFLITDGGEKKIAERIRFHAVGRRHDGTRIAEFRFLDHDGEIGTERFDLSATIARNQRHIVDGLANKGYVWPADAPTPYDILKAVIARYPDKRFKLVGAPGWHDDAMVTPLRQYGGRDRIVIDPTTGAHLPTFVKGPGSLKDWQTTVGQIAKNSSRLRLSIAVAFAAPLLRLLKMDSFALNLFGTTSQGKSSCLVIGASVAGMINEEGGLPRWADSDVAIEQIAIGHRDNLLPLDETADGSGSKVGLHTKAHDFAFLFSRNRAKTLDKTYQKKINLEVRDFRVIALSSSEHALKAIAQNAGQPRLGGEEVRFIDVPAVEPEAIGIFDALQIPHGRESTEYAQKLIDKLRWDAATNQGFPLDAFLKRLVLNPKLATKRATKHMATFEASFPDMLNTGAEKRICASFCAIYAGAALAIEYKVVPWTRESTRLAITKCMKAAFATLAEPTNQMAGAPTNNVVELLRTKLSGLNLVALTKGSCSASEAIQRQAADGFLFGNQIFIKSKVWKNKIRVDAQSLVDHQIIARQRTDTPTIEKKIFGITGKPRYYVLDNVRLQLHKFAPNNS